MKNITIILLITVLVLSGCGSKSSMSEEDLKAEIREELEAEIKAEEKLKAEIREELEAEIEAEEKLKDEIEAESKVDEKKVEEKDQNEDTVVNQEFENGVFVQGYLTCNTAPYFILMDNIETITYDGQEYDYIALSDEILTKYVNKNNYVYNLEGFPMITKSDMLMTIEIDLENAYEGLGYLFIEDYRLVEDQYNNGETLTDYSNSPFPLIYYQEVIKTLCLGMYGSTEENILDNVGYTNDVDFKDAVDRVLSKGYELKRNGGYYIIVNKEAYNIDSDVSIDEICQIVGITIEDFETSENYNDFDYDSHFGNDEIWIGIAHDGLLTGDMMVGEIHVRGYAYKLYDIGIGERVLDVYKELGSMYKGLYDKHSDTELECVFDVNGHILLLNNIKSREYAHIDDNTLVKSIDFWMYWSE